MCLQKSDTTFGKTNVGPEVLDYMDDSVELDLQGITIKAYPTLVAEGKQVNLVALESEKVAAVAKQKALRQLIINALPEQIKYIKKSIPEIQNLCLKYADFGRCDALKQDIINKTIDDVFLYDGISTQDEFNRRLESGKSELHVNVNRWSGLLSNILDEYRTIKKIIKSPALTQLDMVADIQLQLNNLFTENFITSIDKQWLQQYPRYLSGIKKRFDKAQGNAVRDRQLRIDFTRLWDEYVKRDDSLREQHIDSEELDHYRWMLEEYRISLFAQELKTKFPISEKRLKLYWNELPV